jgi:hypothetical protein
MGDRMDVFEKTPPHCLYVPNDSDWTAVATTVCTLAICAAPGKGGHKAARLGPDGITLTQRGTGANTRFINNIAMEALGLGTPVIASCTEGLIELTQNGEFGLLFDRGNPADFAAKINSMLSDERVRERYARREIKKFITFLCIENRIKAS